MSEGNLKIADIIFAYVKGTITDEQLKHLMQWIEESEAHGRLFSQLVSPASFRDKQEVYRRFDRYYNFDLVRRRMAGKRRAIFRKYVAVAAILILPLLGGAGWLLFRSPDPCLPVELALVPGEARAILTLSDGTTRSLNHENFKVTQGSRLVVNGAAGLVYLPRDSNIVEGEKYNEIKVPRGGEYQVTLADGTHVWLNSESSIRFPLNFTREERRVWVSGEVFFSVARDEKHPFVVNGGNLRVRVLGTSFNIRAYEDEENVMTTLVEGSVQVDDNQGRLAVLKPSEQLTYNVKNGENEVRVVDAELFVSWKDGIYLFKSQRLEDIMKQISKWYDVDVLYQHAGVKDILFSGRLKRYENAETLLKVFEQLGGVRFIVQGKTVIVEAG